MVELREEPRLPLEPCPPLAVLGEDLGQHLDGHVTVQGGIPGLPDLPHPAFSQLGLDVVVSKGPTDHDLSWMPIIVRVADRRIRRRSW
jgi:hypothetical protein